MEIIASILLIIFFWKYESISNFFRSLFSKSNTNETSQTIQPETESTDSDIKKAETSTSVNLLQQNQVINSTGVADTDFQDELKATIRTKEEAEKENNFINKNKIINDANKTFDKIKSELLKCGKNGDYTIISGKKVITATVFMPSDYYIRNQVPATFEKVRNSFFDRPQPSLSISEMNDSVNAALQLGLFETNKYRLVLKTHRKTIFEPISDSEFNLFWNKLKKLTAKENIAISPIIIDEKNNKEYTFPCSIERDIGWDEYLCLIKCVCAVPE